MIGCFHCDYPFFCTYNAIVSDVIEHVINVYCLGLDLPEAAR